MPWQLWMLAAFAVFDAMTVIAAQSAGKVSGEHLAGKLVGAILTLVLLWTAVH